MARLFLLLGAVSGAGGILLGAFGAHGLRARLGPELMDVWQTAVQYHLWHALSLLAVGLLLLHAPGSRWLAGAGWGFTLGIVVFSGSLYLLALTGVRTLGAITPLGGLAFVAAWLMLGIGTWRAL